MTGERRNFWIGAVNGALYNFGDAYIRGSTVIPAFIQKLTSSGILIGLASIFEEFWWYLPQLFVSRYLVDKPKVLKYYVMASAFRAVSLWGLAASVFIIGSGHPKLLLTAFFLFFWIYSCGGGYAGVAFMEVVGKVVKPEKRGSFFGFRLTVGGTLAFLSGIFIIRKILESLPFPENFGTLFLIAGIIIPVALFIFSRIDEPEILKRPRKRDAFLHVKHGLSIVKKDRSFKKYFVYRILMGAWGLGMPFYIIFARERLGIPIEMVGVYVAVEFIGYTSLNLVWAYISNNLGNRIINIAISFTGILTPVIVGVASIYEMTGYQYSIVFFVLGVISSGLRMGGLNYLLEISPVEERPTYIGVMNTVTALTILLAPMGGLILDFTSFEVLYGIVLALALASAVSSLYLDEPRVTRRRAITVPEIPPS
ncbi:MAG: MFS transporter, partial [Fidelibacterota bacterium]